mgnify:CR=1 FL=1
MTIDVLGTTYTIYYKPLTDLDGYCDKTTKEIVISTKDDNCNLGNFEIYQNKVLRHEIIHAFMFESGLAENWEHMELGQEETVIDWFAIQGLKIYKAWQQANCI